MGLAYIGRSTLGSRLVFKIFSVATEEKKTALIPCDQFQKWYFNNQLDLSKHINTIPIHLLTQFL